MAVLKIRLVHHTLTALAETMAWAEYRWSDAHPACRVDGRITGPDDCLDVDRVSDHV